MARALREENRLDARLEIIEIQRIGTGRRLDRWLSHHRYERQDA
jgi:hypothetical protein